jgi:hypothetical protein
MKGRSFSVFLLVSLFGIGLLAIGPGSANAAIYGADLGFETAAQSMWAPGDAGILDFNYFIGPEWDVGPGSVGDIIEVETPAFTLIPEVCVWGVCTPAVEIPSVSLGDYGAEISGETDGRIGFDLNIEADSGSVNVEFPVGVTIEYPDPMTVLPGETFTISTGFTEADTAMSTNFPEASLDLDFVFDVYATGGIEVAVVDSAYLSFGTINVDESLDLISIDSNTAETSFDLGFTTIAAQIPDIDTAVSGTDASGNLASFEDDFLLDVDIDLDLIATSLLGLPPLGGEFEVLGAYGYYTLLDVLVGAMLQVQQEFTFDPTLMVQLDFTTGESFSVPVGDSVNIIAPDYTTTIGVTPTFYMDNLFTNTTSLRIDPTFDFELLAAGVGIDFPGVVNDLGIGDLNLGFGPLYELHLTTAGPAIALFSESWELQGFQEFQTAALSIQVPEPNTLVLFVIGLFGAAGWFRWRRKRLCS